MHAYFLTAFFSFFCGTENKVFDTKVVTIQVHRTCGSSLLTPFAHT